MDKEHVKGAADKAKGAVKDAAGKMTDDKTLRRRQDGQSKRPSPSSARRRQGRR